MVTSAYDSCNLVLMVNFLALSEYLSEPPTDGVNYGGSRWTVHLLCLASGTVVASGTPELCVQLVSLYDAVPGV